MKLPLLRSGSTIGINRRRLQTLYLVAAAGLAALVPLMLFAGFWIRSELGKSQRDVEQFLNSRTVSLAQRVDAEIDRQFSALRTLSALPSLDTDPARFRPDAERALAVMPRWFGLAVLSPAGSPLTSAGQDLTDAVDTAVLQQVSTSRRPHVETRSAGEAPEAVMVYVPIVRNDAVTGVLVAKSAGGAIEDIVRSQGRDAGIASIIFDPRDQVIVRSRESEIVSAQVIDEIKAETSGLAAGQFQARVKNSQAMTVSFVRSALTGWVTTAAISARESDRLMSRSVWATAASGALSLVLAGILAVFIIHTVMERRVSEERLGASRALGELDQRLLSTTQQALNEQRKSSSEREVLLREIYHRVKNNLQIVQSLLRLGSRDLRAEQREPFEGAIRRIGAMARVHNLLYNSPDLASIDFKDYLEELLRDLSEGFGGDTRAISHVLDADAMRMPLDTAVPLAFIAVEILTNSFKHAFPDGRAGRITVEVRRSGDDAVMTIRDDGIGLGAEPPGRRQLGLTIVRKLVQQIGGTLAEPAPGASTFVVRFPITSVGGGWDAAEKTSASVSY